MKPHRNAANIFLLIILAGVHLLPASQARAETFHGYECTTDCSGHEAGYEWAKKHNITDPADCGGKSTSFIEGCKAYAGEEGDVDDEEDSDEDSN